MNGSNAPTSPVTAPTYFTPQELAAALGVSISTIKRWADQGRFPVRRTEGGHRRIPRDAALGFLAERGFRPGVLLGDAAPSPSAAPAAVGELSEDSAAGFYYRLLSEGREWEVLRQVQADHRRGQPLAEILDSGLAPALRHIGRLWEQGRTGIFTEHVAARITGRVLDALHQERGEPAADAPLALGGTPEDDAHGLAAAMAAGVLEEAGWRVVDLGGFCPATVLAEQARAHGAGLVFLALGRQAAPDLQTARLEHLRQLLGSGPDAPALIAGGPAYRAHPFPAPAGALLVDSLPELASLVADQAEPQAGIGI